MKSLSTILAATTIGMSGCDLCGPEQHAVTTSASNFTLSGDIAPRDVQYTVVRLTEPPASHEQFQFVFNTLEGSTNGEGVALAINGTDAVTQEIVTLVLALPVALREGDVYSVGGTFNIEVGTSSETGLWGPHDLVDPHKADVAFVVAAYTFPPPMYTPSFRAVSSTGTIKVASRSDGQLQLIMDLSFTDANGQVRTVTGNAQASTEKSAALCS